MLAHFRTYKLAVEFHHQCRSVKMPDYLKDQILRASSSISLNLAEGSGRSSRKDQLRFFHHSLGSLRECQVCDTRLTFVVLRPLDVGFYFAVRDV